MVRRQFDEGTKLLHIVGTSCLNPFQAGRVFWWGVSACLHCSYALRKAWGKPNDHETQQRREERKISVKRLGMYRFRGTRGGWSPPWRRLRSQWTVVTDAVLGDFRGKGNGYRRRRHQDSSPGFLFLLLGMVGEVDQEIPWLSGTTDGEGIKKTNKEEVWKAPGEGPQLGTVGVHTWLGPCVAHDGQGTL